MVRDVLTPCLLSSQIELIMDAIHKNRNLQYKKTMEVKQMCCRFLSCGLTLLRCMAVGHLDVRVFLLCCKSICCVRMSGVQAVLSTAEKYTRLVVALQGWRWVI